MNTKIIVALVIGMVLIGLTGVASASLYDNYMARSSGSINTNTDITGTHFTSESLLTVSGIPVEQQYEQEFIGKFRYPTYPPVDLYYNTMDIQGDRYTLHNEIESTPTGSRIITGLNNPSVVSGTWEHWDCAMWGAGEGPTVASFPQPIFETSGYGWCSGHPEGSAYPAHSIEYQSIYWP